ncbi:MAG: sulfite exporter TauE/SafE family protein, partial [Myxococcales bacterium]|nr:sulfite exporter TauE/SafE family protein [Myxococcales bacterium]
MSLVLAALLALPIGLSLGLLGGGGSILTVPLLVYVLGVEPKAAIATSLFVVGVTSLAALLPHARAGAVRWRTGLVFGGAGMVGAYLAGHLADAIPGRLLLILFAALMLVTAVAMLWSRAAPERKEMPRAELAVRKAVLDGLVVGALTGLVGAGGGFLVVPALAMFGGLPMRAAAATSLVVIAMKSFAGFSGYLGHQSIDWGLALVV